MGVRYKYFPITQSELERLRAAPDSVEDFFFNDGRVRGIDKAWQGIHFLLTGDPVGGSSPLASLIMGGEPFGSEDVRLLDADEVSAVSQAIERIDKRLFVERFDPKRLEAADIYPGGWDEGDVAVEYLVQHYERLRQDFLDAAKAGQAILVYLG